MAEGEVSTDILQNTIKKITENPDALKSIMGLIGNMNLSLPKEGDTPEKKESDIIESDKDTASEKNTIAASTTPDIKIPPEILASLPTIMSALGGKDSTAKSKSCSQREALLCALKPYLSPHKAEAIDKIIQLSKLGDILGFI